MMLFIFMLGYACSTYIWIFEGEREVRDERDLAWRGKMGTGRD